MSFATLLLAAGLLLAPAAQAQEAPFAVDAAALPRPADGVLALRAFTLDEPRPYPWMKGHAPLTRGLLIALEVDPALAVPRQVDEPVIYVGDVPAERLNVGWPSGRLLLLVPGEPDLGSVPVFFGPPELPERIDLEHAAADLAQARAVGLAPFADARIRAALVAGGEPLVLRDSRALDHAIADWIDAWAPDEADRAEGLRAPSP
jgi:hypothetical protein